ncbi:hypothetical protein [Streptomyces sp. NPDC048277]|uniref:hypothetical protein n=1 Tax=Streptomyces sp. NPDC048277 TaxID=3155027 RepID=UPI0033D7EB31
MTGYLPAAGVADAEPHLPDLCDAGMGAGLRMVAERAAEHGGDVTARPAADLTGRGQRSLPA